MIKTVLALVFLFLCFRVDASVEQIGVIEKPKYPGMEINPSYNPVVAVGIFIDPATISRIDGRFKMWDVKFGYSYSEDGPDPSMMRREIINCDLLVKIGYGGFTDYDINQSRSDAITYVSTAKSSSSLIEDKYICDYLESRRDLKNGRSSSSPKASRISDARKNVKLSIPLRQRGGVYEVQATLNSEIKAYFVVDSGAADVTISEDVAKILANNESLTASDLVGSKTYSFANGASGRGAVIRIKRFDLGGYILEDVRAVVMKGRNVPLLLGQSAFHSTQSFALTRTSCEP